MVEVDSGHLQRLAAVAAAAAAGDVLVGQRAFELAAYEAVAHQGCFVGNDFRLVLEHLPAVARPFAAALLGFVDCAKDVSTLHLPNLLSPT